MRNRPNILFIVSHDIGRRLGCYGHAEVQSPHLDALAASGMCMEQAFCSHPQCSPARASLFTGRYPHSNGVMGLTHGPFQWDLHANEEHLAGILGKAGYRSMLAGIQHETMRPQDMGWEHIQPRSGQWAEHVTNDALQALDSGTDDRPFYLQLGYFEGHRAPNHPVGPFGPMPTGDVETVTLPAYLQDNHETREEFAALHGSIRSLDTQLGRLFDGLRERQLYDNTVIVFCADHGLPFPRAKTSCFDPGLEIAMLWSGPGISVGRSAAMVSGVDVLPTLCALLDLQAPAAVQGQSFAAVVQGTASEHRQELFAEQTNHNYLDPMRCLRTDRYKLILNFLPVAAIYNSTQQWQPKSCPVLPEDVKNTVHPPMELYDLQADPDEFVNLIDKPELAAVQNALIERLAQHLRDTDDPLLKGPPVPPRYQAMVQSLQAAIAV